MKKIVAGLLAFACFSATLRAQTSAFVYQGALNRNGVAASGIYDLRFTVYDAVTNGNAVVPSQTNPSVSVSNGSFTVQLDFGANVFNGNGRWIDIGVRTNGDPNPYTTLTPRQPITSTPYAIQAANAAVAVTANYASAVSATNISGALTLTQLPTALITNNSANVNLTGTFSGPGTFKWETTSGTAQQAANNTGYFATNSSQVTITLPVTSTVGDVLRVSGSGLGGWKIAQNSGQVILAGNLAGNSAGAFWTARDTNRTWYSIASSADGTKLVAVANNDLIYTSTDSGATWTAHETNRTWKAVASSADGTKLVAAANTTLCTSTDSGATWTVRDTSPKNWYSLASSADGTKLVGVGAKIYTSTDSGVTWTNRETTRSWYSVTSSSDGSKLVAVVYNGQIYNSTDSGVTWTPRESNQSWSSVASSADGTKLVASVNTGQIYTSSDSGVTWVPHENFKQWYTVASSADGTRLAAGVYNGQIYTSGDSGISWTPRDSTRTWFAIASSADGSKLATAAVGGQIYTSQLGTFPGTGYLLGQQYSAIELQYLGDGQWMPISYVGTISVY